MEPMEKKQSPFAQGLRDGIPIALGYFAVAFSLGIAARDAGLTPFQGMLASLLCVASAGEYALFTLVGAGAAYLEVALVTLITNARYFLMSCALSQRIRPDMPDRHRWGIGLAVTDEIFGISIARPGPLEPRYHYGAMAVSIPAWAIGTALGILMGTVLPPRVVSALSVALYGMFLAIIIPPARKELSVAICVLTGFGFSWLFGFLPALRDLSAGMRTILLTLVVIYAIRVLPLTLIRKPLRSRFLRSFLYYVPYVTLAVMTFPAIVEATALPAAGIAALAVGIIAALLGASLLTVAGACCAAVFLLELIFT